MDLLSDDDIERARATAPGQKLAQALEMMETGIRLKRAALCLQHPEASVEEIERLLRLWLETDA